MLSNPLTIVVVVVLWNLRSETDPTEKCEKMDLILQRVEEPLRSNSVCSRTPILTLPYEPEEFPFFLEKKNLIYRILTSILVEYRILILISICKID